MMLDTRGRSARPPASSSRYRVTSDDAPSPSPTLPSSSVDRHIPTLLSSPNTLADLTPALLFLIAQFLSWKSKLLHCTHICHSYPALISKCFIDDLLPLRPLLLRKLSSTPRLASLLSEASVASLSSSLVSAALYGEMSDLISPPLPPSPRPLLSTFSSLQSLVLCLDEDEEKDPSDDCPGFYERLFSALGRDCPHLISLHCETERKKYPPQVMSTQSLGIVKCLKQLRTLRLGFLLLEFSALALLSSLPLISYLDVSGCLILGEGQCPWKETKASQFHPSRSLNSLFIPRHEASSITAVLDVLNRCSDAHRPKKAVGEEDEARPHKPGHEHCCFRGEGLDYLSADVKRAHLLLPLLPLISSLMSLDLDGSDGFDLTPLYGDHTPQLPKLCEFRASSLFPDDWTDGWLNQIANSYPRFIQTYRTQLRALDLRIPNTALCLPALREAFSCSDLRLLDLQVVTKDDNDLRTAIDCSSFQPTTMPHLHTFMCNAMQNDEQIKRFIPAYPSLEDITLVCPAFPALSTVASIGRSCRSVRRIRFIVGEEASDEEAFTPLDNTVPLFPLLAHISLLPREDSTFLIPNTSLLPLATLLRSHAPNLRYVRAGIDNHPKTLRMLSFPSLLALRTSSPFHSQFFHRHHAHPIDSREGRAEYGRFAGFTLGSEVLDAARMAEEAREDFHGCYFITDEIFEGKNGREAFFALQEKAAAEAEQAEELKGGRNLHEDVTKSAVSVMEE